MSEQLTPYVDSKGFNDATESLIIKNPNDLSTAQLEVVYNNGKSDTFTGLKALANTRIPNKYSDALKFNNPELYAQSITDRLDNRNSIPYTLANQFSKWMSSKKPGFFGKNFNTPFSATAAGAAIGGAGTALLHTLGQKLGIFDKKDIAIPSLIGAGVGAAAGYVTNKQNPLRKEGSCIQKVASMYQDPRNFILEKLQRSNDIPLVEKALLASKVRNMDKLEATRLEKMVRASLGIGVGTIIAKHFGAGTFGTIMGGLLGAIGVGMTNWGSSIFNK